MTCWPMSIFRSELQSWVRNMFSHSERSRGMSLSILKGSPRDPRLRFAALRMTRWIALASAQARDRWESTFPLGWPGFLFSPAATRRRREEPFGRRVPPRFETGERPLPERAGNGPDSLGPAVVGFGWG